MPHGQFWMCLWDVQILIMKPSSRSESKMSIILSKKVLKYLSKNISDFKKKKSSQFLDVCWYGEGFCHIVQNLRYMAQETCKNCGDFFFFKSVIFFDKHFKIFLERIMHVLDSLQDDSLIESICTSHRHIQNWPWGTF